MTRKPQSDFVPAWPAPPVDVHEAIRQRAQEIFLRSGSIPGRDTENWLQAEAEIRQEFGQHFRKRTAIVVNVEGVQYVGEYTPESSSNYRPGEFAGGQPISVRFDGEKMFIRRPNGTELETIVVKKIG
jgi:Protein of unknown function (DUF2934)